MSYRYISLPVLILIMVLPTAAEEWPAPTGPYLGQEPPGGHPKVFAPGLTGYDGERYRQPAKITGPINTDYGESCPHIAPDQSYLLFHSNRDGSFGSMDIFISHRSEDGAWSEPVNLGPTLNSKASDFGASVTPDGRYLFFPSYRGLPQESISSGSYNELLSVYRNPANGYATLYWIDTAALSQLP